MTEGRFRISYRSGRAAWEIIFSDRERIIIERKPQDLGLDEARTAARGHLAAKLNVGAYEIDEFIGREYVQVPEMSGIDWHGLSFVIRAPDFGIEKPTEVQIARLQDCFAYYRDNVPEGMKVELYANRVRLEPGAFGQRGAIIDALAGRLAEAVPDELDLAVAARSTGIDQAREQMHRAKLFSVPDGFVRVVVDLAGFEGEGDLGVIYLVLKERWHLDQPW